MPEGSAHDGGTWYLAAKAVLRFGLNEKGEMPVLVWRFRDAPKELRELSKNGGDEDYLAYFPPGTHAEEHNWCDPGWAPEFGCCDIGEYKLPDGAVVRIGCHS